MPSGASTPATWTNVTSAAVMDILPQNYTTFGYTNSVATGTTMPTFAYVPPSVVAPRKKSAMEWLRDRVDEMADVGRQALAEPW